MEGSQLLYRMARFLARILLLALRARIEGSGNVAKVGNSYLVVSNHVSEIDPILFHLLWPTALMSLAKRQLFSYPVIKQVLIEGGAVPLDAAKILWVIKELKMGLQPFLIFPEGRINRCTNLSLLPMETTAGFIAAKSSVPVVPTVVVSLPGIRWLSRKIIIGQPLVFPPGTAEAVITSAIDNSIRQLLRSNLKEGNDGE